MTSLLSVRWTIKPLTAPRPLLPCSGCGKSETFQSSDRFRLNANGKRLDAWLLYRCATCETTWKRPVIERRNVQALDPAFLRALQSNDRALAETLAFDLTDLRRFARQIEVCSEVTVKREILTGSIAPADLMNHLDPPRSGARARCWTSLEIALSVPVAAAQRTDRLLANELRLPRARIRKLEETGCLSATLHGRYKLGRPVADQLNIRIDLSGEAGACGIAKAAALGLTSD